jgi:hypothetical protein
MGKGRDKRKRNRQRATEEIDLVREKEMERVAREDAERRARLSPKHFAGRPSSDPPPILGEPDPRVRAPLKPKPHLRSGAIALCEPKSEEQLLIVKSKSTSK